MEQDQVAAGLRSRATRAWQEALEAAVALGDAGEGLLLDALASSSGDRKLVLVSTLGELRRPGPADVALTQVLEQSGPGTRNLRCAALVALARRSGPAATPAYAYGLQQPDPAVREYALVCLNERGDGRAFDVVLAQLRASPTSRPVETRALRYLLRHVGAQGPTALRELAAELRDRRRSLEREGQQELVAAVWPELENSEDPDAPAPSTLHLLDYRTADTSLVE